MTLTPSLYAAATGYKFNKNKKKSFSDDRASRSTMELESLNDVVLCAAEQFAPVITVAGLELHRQLLAIDSAEHPLSVDDGVCMSYVREPREAEQLLWQLLEILDHNLGETYARSSRALYHNSRPWRVNKWSEMLTEGLVYVVYAAAGDGAGRGASRRGPARAPRLFVSFMLTAEDGVCARDPSGVWGVLYVYELQLLPRVRRHGVAARLVGRDLTACCRQLRAGRNARGVRLYGLELTVFADNAPAIGLYERLGMQLAADSPASDDHDALYRLYVLRV